MSNTKTINFDTGNAPLLKDKDGNTLDSSSIFEVLAGTKIGLKSIVDSDELLYGNFATKDLLRTTGLGVGTGTLGGGATVSGGKLNMNNSAAQWVINPQNMQGADPNVLTIRFKITPQYSGAPSTLQTFFQEQTAGVQNQIAIRHVNGSGDLGVVFTDSAAVPKSGITVVSWSPTSGQTYEMELNINTTTGSQKFFIDGVQVGSDPANVYTRTNTATLYQHGITTAVQNFQIDDTQRFSTVKHTSNFTSEIPRTVTETYYPTTEEVMYPLTMPGLLSTGMDSLSSFASVIDETSGTVKFVVYNGTNYIYHNGVNWVTSDLSIAQANTVAEINAGKADMIGSPGQIIEFIPILISTDGSGTPSITSQTITYSFWRTPIIPGQCEIYGNIYDNYSPVSGAVINITSKRIFPDSNGNYIAVNEEITTDSDGYFNINIAKSKNYDEVLKFKVTFTDNMGEQQEREIKAVIPNQDSASLESIAV